MKIMISHDHREQALVNALRVLLETVSHGKVEVWFSSDVRPEGGMDTGNWWQTLEKRISESHYVIAVLTPVSMKRPWIQWECGSANSQEETRDVVPLLFNMGMATLEGPLAGFNAYKGDDADSIVHLLNRLLRWVDIHLDGSNMDDYKPHLDYYLNTVNDFFEKHVRQKLFDRSFHNADSILEGIWYATWYTGDDKVYVRDRIEIFMEQDRVQAIGYIHPERFEGEIRHYPLEGRLSADRRLTLNYWDVYGSTICGAVLLEVAGTARKMVGEWIGWTTDSVHTMQLQLLKGKVVWSRTPHKDATDN